MPSNIRAFVQWKDPTVFAGEDIECVITFRNTAKVQSERDGDKKLIRQRSRYDILRPEGGRQRATTQSTVFSRPGFNRAPSITSNRTASKGHQHTLSLNVFANPDSPHARTNSTTSVAVNNVGRPSHNHGRSLSIMSLGSDGQHASSSRGPPSAGLNRKPRGHGRSSSMQITTRVSPAISPPLASAPFRQPSPLQEANTPPLEGGQFTEYINPRHQRRRSGIKSVPNTPGLPKRSESQPESFAPQFKFPPEPSPPKEPIFHEQLKPTLTRTNLHSTTKNLRASSPSNADGMLNALHPISRVISENSVAESPRESSDFYSMSNRSDETVASELPSRLSSRLLSRPPLSRQTSTNTLADRSKEPEHLMMAYAQTMGFFSLDGSLVNQAPFEEVKRKGVVGGQGGGGVVGVGSKRESGLFGSLGWGNIGESLTGLLGMDEMSSMKEMRSLASMKNIPLLSTPQSILCVDLRLAPGESRSYSYKFKIPTGLPPSHKGRSIKVQYNLRLGVQRSGKLNEQQNMKFIEIPFRVLGSVSNDGEILGHNLMSPYIMLRDNSKTSLLPSQSDITSFLSSAPDSSTKASGTLNDFLAYTELLLSQDPSTAPLASPTSPSTRRSSTDPTASKMMRDRISHAILRSNTASSDASRPAQSSNRFTIARAGTHIGVLILLRPAYRLGETVLGSINLTAPPSSARQKVFILTISLESTECVDTSLALRSANSIARVTKKIHASTTECALFAREIGFALEIPLAATPSFETTGVRGNWKVRVEFVTAVAGTEGKGLGIGIEEDEDQTSRDQGGVDHTADGMLEEVSEDGRGTVLIARENLRAETFEVGVPIRVYGASDGVASGIGEGMEI